MPNYLTPGVYVEEVPSGARPIQAQSTSTPCFIGFGGGKPGAPVGVPTAITNWTQYQTLFLADGPMTPLSHAVNGFFANTQGRCYILDLGPDGKLSGTPDSPGLSILEAIDEIAIIAAPGYTDPADYEVLIGHCEGMKDRVAILDAPMEVKDIMALTRVATDSSGQPADGGAPAGGDGGGGGGGGGGQPTRPRRQQEAVGARATAFAAMYHPWVKVVDLNTGQRVFCPPSGHMAGIWARTDATRGVHKAPANEPMRGVFDVYRRVAPSEQGELNEAGINVIRMFDTLGIRPWGARTLARELDPQWRYLNVRRLFCMAEESIAKGTNWIVFEPNDRELWSMVVNALRAFLTGLWRDGALMGRTPEEAFFVKCDEETNPPDVVDAGRVVAIVGMAPVKPAEFVVFKVAQFSGGTTFEEESIRA